MIAQRYRKARGKREKNISKNQTQLVTATQPSSLHSAALPRSSVKLPPLLCCSHRTAQTSLQTSPFQSVPQTEPRSRRFVQPGAAAAPISQVPAVPPQQRVPRSSRLLLPSQGPPPLPSQEGSGQADAISAHFAGDTWTGGGHE